MKAQNAKTELVKAVKTYWENVTDRSEAHMEAVVNTLHPLEKFNSCDAEEVIKELRGQLRFSAPHTGFHKI